MKIVDRATFLAMPAGTLFSKWEPCLFEDLRIKGDTIFDTDGAPIDFSYQAIADALDAADSGDFFAAQDRAAATGDSLALDLHCEARDGCFDQDKMFAVWEPDDVRALIERLQETLFLTAEPSARKWIDEEKKA